MTESDVESERWFGLDWSDWGPLKKEEGHLATAPTDEGLYRVRHPDYEGLVYIGETGRSTSGRIHSLARGAFSDEMPFRDPHTAAPCLWAIRDRDGPDLEVSWTTPARATKKQPRKGIEAALIALHRREIGHSPTANFGRIIEGYKQSGYSSDGFVGGPLSEDETEPNTEPGVGPLEWTDHERPLSTDWMGLDWTEPEPLDEVSTDTPTTDGLYRLWNAGDPEPLTYIGESSNLKSRLYSHRRERNGGLRYSYAVLDEHNAQHKRQEVETELIGAHWVSYECAPVDQF